MHISSGIEIGVIYNILSESRDVLQRKMEKNANFQESPKCNAIKSEVYGCAKFQYRTLKKYKMDHFEWNLMVFIFYLEYSRFQSVQDAWLYLKMASIMLRIVNGFS